MQSQPCTAGTHCRDACGGREEEISGLDNFKYRYYMGGVISDLQSLPSDPKPAAADLPFTMNCYKGCTWTQISGGTCTGSSSGTTSSYTAAANLGMTEVFTGYPSSSTKSCATASSRATAAAAVGSTATTTTTSDDSSSSTGIIMGAVGGVVALGAAVGVYYFFKSAPTSAMAKVDDVASPAKSGQGV